MSDVHFNEVGARKRSWCFQNLHLTPWRVFLFLSVRIICSYPWPNVRTPYEKNPQTASERVEMKKKIVIFFLPLLFQPQPTKGGCKKNLFLFATNFPNRFSTDPKRGTKKFPFLAGVFFPPLSFSPSAPASAALGRRRRRMRPFVCFRYYCGGGAETDENWRTTGRTFQKSLVTELSCLQCTVRLQVK